MAPPLEWLLSNSKVKSIAISKEVILKDLRSIPACDGKSFFHCREWTQLAFQILSSNQGHTVDETKMNDYRSSMAAENALVLELGAGGPNADDICSELEMMLNGQMMNRSKRKLEDEDEQDEQNVEELLRNMKQSLREWLDSKAHFSVPNEIFPPAVLPQESKVPVATSQSRDITQILRMVTFNKNNITLPKSNFARLKQMLADRTVPTRSNKCHDPSIAQTPVEMERISEEYNERIRAMKTKIESALQKHASTMCEPLPLILDTVQERMLNLHRISGPSKLKSLVNKATDECDGAKLIPFTSYWHDFLETYKRTPKFEHDGRLVRVQKEFLIIS